MKQNINNLVPFWETLLSHFWSGKLHFNSRFTEYMEKTFDECLVLGGFSFNPLTLAGRNGLSIRCSGQVKRKQSCSLSPATTGCLCFPTNWGHRKWSRQAAAESSVTKRENKFVFPWLPWKSRRKSEGGAI